ncbi:hypothetical protein M3Y97_00009500 [Aphelenchoides bicaudatus]|nr:hypothetical protein M3Y97_00009500 [Aphelenchoides bicaudatus]
MIALLERVRRGSIPGYTRMSSGVRGMLVRPDESFFNAQQAEAAQQSAALKEQLPDPTFYMLLCLIADLLIWTLAGFIIYKAIRSCRKSTLTEESQKLADRYDRLEADFDSCSLSSTDSDLHSYAEAKMPAVWLPAVFTSDGKLKKIAPNQVRLFRLPKMTALTRWHSIPNFMDFDKHGPEFV